MRVVIVSKALLVGAYRGKLTELARLGAEVTAVVPHEWREAGQQRVLEAEPDKSYRLIVAPVRWSGHFHLYYFPGLRRIIAGLHPDLLHMDEEPYNLATYLGVRAGGRSGIPSVFFTWQNVLRRYPPPFGDMERSVYRSVSRALAGSQEAGRVLREKGYEGPLSVVPQFGVDPDTFSPGRRSHDRFTVGLLNRLVPEKAPLLALEAFASLPADAQLRIVGDGPMRGRVEAEIEARGLASRVSLESRVPSTDMPDLIRGLDAVLLPSVTTPRWKEQFGRVLIEAMACGVAVVGSDSGEIPEVIGDAGIVVPEGDLAAWRGALRRLYDDASLREELGRRGRERVLRRFTQARIAELTYEAYAQTLGRPIRPWPEGTPAGSRLK